MGTIPLIRNSSGEAIVVEEGEAVQTQFTFYAPSDPDNAIEKASLVTLTATLYNESDGTAINLRDDLTVLDANGGSVTDAGVLTLKLLAADNPIVGSNLKEEDHILRLKWTWQDADSVTWTGIQEWKIRVRKLTTVS